MIKNNNMTFGAYFSHGTQVWEKADWEALERMGIFFDKLASGVLDPKRKVPKDGVWAIGKLKEMINPDTMKPLANSLSIFSLFVFKQAIVKLKLVRRL